MLNIISFYEVRMRELVLASKIPMNKNILIIITYFYFENSKDYSYIDVHICMFREKQVQIKSNENQQCIYSYKQSSWCRLICISLLCQAMYRQHSAMTAPKKVELQLFPFLSFFPWSFLNNVGPFSSSCCKSVLSLKKTVFQVYNFCFTAMASEAVNELLPYL